MLAKIVLQAWILSDESVSRLVDVSINTVAKLLIDAGKFCAAFHDDMVRGVKAFVRIHQTLKITPAMAAKVTPKLWEMSDIVKVLEDWEIEHAGSTSNA